jgi:hypothetical protein
MSRNLLLITHRLVYHLSSCGIAVAIAI